ATSAFMKVIDFAGEKAELASPVMNAATFVIELGLAVHSANKKNDEEKERQDQFGERMESVGKHAAATARSSTELLMQHFGGLMNDYGSARARLAQIAGEDAGRLIATIQQGDGRSSNHVQETYGRAQEIVL